MKKVIILLASALLLASQSYAKDESFSKYFNLTPLFDLPKESTYSIRVGFIESPQYYKLTHDEKDLLLKKTEKIVKERLGFSISMNKVWVKPATKFYQEYSYLKSVPAVTELLSYDLDAKKIDTNQEILPGELYVVASKLVNKHGNKKVREYIDNNIENEVDTAILLVKQFIYIFKALRESKTIDGFSVLDLDNQQQHSFWHLDAILHNLSDVDFIFTNCLIAIPDKSMPLYTMARGGVNTGATEDNFHNQFRGAAFLSLYPFLASDNFMKKVTGNIPTDERVNIAAYYTAHELGHLLDRRVEIYDHEHCISKASTSLNYYNWYKNVLDKEPCKLEHPKINGDF